MQAFFTLLTLLTILFSFIKSDCTPEQIHLSLSDSFTLYPGSDSPMRAIFHTKEPCNSAYITLTTPEGVQKLTATSNYCYKRNTTAGFFISYVHTFDFPPLDYSKSYEYSCYGGDDFLDKQVGPFKFYVPNPKHQKGQETNVVLFADMDDTEYGMPTINRLAQIAQTNFTKISAFFHIGDMAYNLHRNAGRRGDEYMRAIQPFTAIMPYMVTAGNHENHSNFSNFNMRFKMPLFKQTQNHYYSFGIGNMHFVSFNLDLLNVNPDPSYRKAMLDWLKQDLDRANKNRLEKPWVIALTHRPLYCSFKGSDDCLHNQERFADFEDLLVEQRVDLLFAGHVHIYERMLPIRRGKVTPFEHSVFDIKFRRIINPQTPIHVVQGMAGHRGDPGDPQDIYQGRDFTVKVSKEYSYLAVRSSNSTHLKVENYESVKGTINDYFYIIRTNPPLQVMLPKLQKPSLHNDRRPHP